MKSELFTHSFPLTPSFFFCNIFRTLLSERNTLAHLPFSADTRAFVKAHLERGGYILASKDEALLDFLANTESAEVFSPDELIQDIVDRDLHIIANHSAFQQTPYSVLDDYTVLSYRSFGIGEEQFIWYICSCHCCFVTLSLLFRNYKNIYTVILCNTMLCYVIDIIFNVQGRTAAFQVHFVRGQ